MESVVTWSSTSSPIRSLITCTDSLTAPTSYLLCLLSRRRLVVSLVQPDDALILSRSCADTLMSLAVDAGLTLFHAPF